MLNRLIATSFIVGCILGGIVFNLKYKVVEMEQEINRLRSKIKDHKEHINILEAEWSYLNNPMYVERLSVNHLGYRPIQNSQILTLKQLKSILNEKDEIKNEKSEENSLPEEIFSIKR